jgi:hypothetical protein
MSASVFLKRWSATLDRCTLRQSRATSVASPTGDAGHALKAAELQGFLASRSMAFVPLSCTSDKLMRCIVVIPAGSFEQSKSPPRASPSLLRD